LDRLREGATDRGCWDEEWVKAGRLEVITGDLGLDHFGLNDENWTRIANEADVILHNGALVRETIAAVLGSMWLTFVVFRSIGSIHMKS
jgi:thioester reductase-like protein